MTAHMISGAMMDPTFPRMMGHIPKKSGPRIASGRNSLVRHFLDIGADWLFMVDDDMVFPPDAVERLLQAAHPQDRPIVGGMCFGGGRDGWFPTLFRLDAEQKQMIRFDGWPEDTLFPVDATGGACLLIHRSVFQKLAELYEPPWVWFQETKLGAKSTGEDITFCLRARAAGFPIYVHTGIEFGHMKLVEINTEFVRAWQERSRFVVTGTGRCGTGYMAKLLTAMGVPCGHEMVYKPDGPEWSWIRGDSSWLAAPHLEAFDGYVLHLVRDPLDVLNSYVGLGFFEDEHSHGAYRGYAERYAPGVFGHGDPLLRVMAFIVEWNRMVEPHADARMRVEELSGDDLLSVVRAAGAHHTSYEIEQAIERAPKNENTRGDAAELGLDDLPGGVVKDEFLALRMEYGYG